MATMTERGVQSPLLTIARGGWTMYYPHVPNPDGGGGSKAERSHYGTTWREHANEFTDDALVVCSLVAPFEDIYVLATAGPMVDVDVPSGLKRDPFTNTLSPWDPRPLIDRPEHCARLGNARSLDYVAIDVYAGLATKFGCDVLTVKQALETNYDPKECR